MKKLLSFGLLLSISGILALPSIASAATRSSYKSAKTGRYVTKSYAGSHKATTYKTTRRK